MLADGARPARDKRRVALGVAMAVRERSMIRYHAAVLRHAADTDRDILEVLGVVDHSTTLNRRLVKPSGAGRPVRRPAGGRDRS
jgi:hypothetical protein